MADNPGLAAATGINVERVINVVWIGGAALAGLAGALLGLTQGFDYQLGFRILLLVFAAVVLGGLGTIWGAIVGAFVIGLLHRALDAVHPDPEFKFVGRAAPAHRRPADQTAGPARQGAEDRLRRAYDMDFPELLSVSLQQAFGPTADHLLLGGDRPQHPLRLHRTAQLRPGGLHDGRRATLWSSVATIWGLNLWLGSPSAVVMTVILLALLLGVPTLRLRADYLAIVTIAAAEIIRQIISAANFSEISVARTVSPASSSPSVT